MLSKNGIVVSACIYIFKRFEATLAFKNTSCSCDVFRFKPPGILEKKKEWQVIPCSETKEH